MRVSGIPILNEIAILCDMLPAIYIAVYPELGTIKMMTKQFDLRNGSSLTIDKSKLENLEIGWV